MTPRILATTMLILTAGSLLAKDEKDIPIEACPPAVRAVIQDNITRSRGTLQKLEIETKDKTVLYDAKIIDGNGKRWSLKLSPEGKVLEAKEKAEKAEKPKK
jgi:hypothetical protein